MKKVFALSINGKFSQYLLPSEVRLLKWDNDFIYTLTPILMELKRYNILFGKN